MRIRKRQSAAREFLYEPNFLQNLDSLVDLVLRNRGADVLRYLLHVHHAAVQIQVGAHGGNPPVLKQLEFCRLEAVAFDIAKGESLRHQFLFLRLVLADSGREEQIKIFGFATAQRQDFLGSLQRMGGKVLFLLQHTVEVAGIESQLVAHHAVAVEGHLRLAAFVVVLQEVAVVRYVRKSNHQL